MRLRTRIHTTPELAKIRDGATDRGNLVLAGNPTFND
jgi:hypothetical protein